MGDFSDDYDGYDFYERMELDEQRYQERRAQRAKLLTPPKPEQEPQRKPLTNEEIYKIYRDCGDLNVKINIARAIEAAHGIKEQT